ncbi:uncharacterized protein [Henckelia pumila]|uniref:uncharacterized protein n=1 Tax=Henckelia pumila TaxID=405737 RepID=UPI003C6DE3BB
MPFISCGIYIRDHVSKSLFEFFVLFTWAIWKEICKVRHGPNPKQHVIKVQWVHSFLEEYRRAKRSCLPNPDRMQLSLESKWKKPPLRQLRLDVDADFNEQLGLYSVGAVIRDHLGNICVAASRGIRNPGTVVAAELVVVHFGLMLVLQGDFSNVWVFSDSLNVVQAINDFFESLAHDGLIILNISELLRSGRFKKFSSIRRSANSVAHSLANFALFHSSPMSWVEGSYPSWLMDVATLDLSL